MHSYLASIEREVELGILQLEVIVLRIIWLAPGWQLVWGEVGGMMDFYCMDVSLL